MALSEPQSKGEGETKGEEEKVEKAEQWMIVDEKELI